MRQNIKRLTAGRFSGGLRRGGELCPECEFTAVKLQEKNYRTWRNEGMPAVKDDYEGNTGAHSRNEEVTEEASR